MRYCKAFLWDKPFGEIRFTWKSSDPALIPSAYTLTRQTFTDQYSYADDPSTAGVEGFGLMFYQSRFYDPSLGRFSSPDTIIPESQGVQAWDRFAYANNNPILHNDPTGHCVDLPSCLTETMIGLIKAAGYLAVTATKNGEITSSDWEDAANFGLPSEPFAAGSKIEVGGIETVVTESLTFVTTTDGDAQLFYEYGGGEATPQLDVFASHGLIYGSLNSAADYQGLASQISGGYSPTLAGGAVTAWVADGGGVGGFDVAATLGPGLPISVGLMITNAEPIDNAAYSFEGPELLVCRALYMCGR